MRGQSSRGHKFNAAYGAAPGAPKSTCHLNTEEHGVAYFSQHYQTACSPAQSTTGAVGSSFHNPAKASIEVANRLINRCVVIVQASHTCG
jgi:hypothetical protein